MTTPVGQHSYSLHKLYFKRSRHTNIGRNDTVQIQCIDRLTILLRDNFIGNVLSSLGAWYESREQGTKHSVKFICLLHLKELS